MFKVRLAVLGALALFIVSGVAASTASATGPFWHVGGSKFLTGETRQIKLQSKASLVLKSSGAGLEIECKNSISEGSTIEGSTTTAGQGKGRVSYSSCKVLKPTVCTVTEPIITNPLKSHLVTAATQSGIAELFEPGQGTVFVVLHFTSCGAITEAGINGSIAAEVNPAKVEGQEGAVVFPSPSISKVKLEGVEKEPKLTSIGFAATFSGVYAARLATFPEKFGVFET